MGYNSWLDNDYVVNITLANASEDTEVIIKRRIRCRDSHIAMVRAGGQVALDYPNHTVTEVSVNHES